MPATTAKKKALIVYDHKVGSIIILCPFNAEFVQELKNKIGTEQRSWHHETKTWRVYGSHKAMALYVARKYYDVEIISDTRQDDIDHDSVIYLIGYKAGRQSATSVNDFHTFASNLFSGQQRSSFSPSNADDYALLGIVQGASPDLIRAAYRVASMKAHPDQGGTNEAMVKVNAAYERLMKLVAV